MFVESVGFCGKKSVHGIAPAIRMARKRVLSSSMFCKSQCLSSGSLLGIGKSEPIGNFKNLRGAYGAAGGEVDKVDLKLGGTPLHTMVLATSAAFDSTWAWDPIDPPSSPRSDMALLEYPNGGAVFSVSSIAWCSCPSYNASNNNVSHVTKNVLNGVLNR